MKTKKLNQISALVFIWIVSSAFLESANGLNKKANKLYEEKKYQSALSSYQSAQTKKPNEPEILYNVGTTLYQMDHFQDSASYLDRSIKQGNQTDQSFQAKNWYNYGNAQYRLGKYEEAIRAYKKTLELDPNDKDAKHNLEFIQKKKAQFESKKQDEEREHPKKNPDQPQNQNQQQKEDQNQGGGGGGSENQEKKDEQQGNQGEQEEEKQKQGGESGKSGEEREQDSKSDQKEDKSAEQDQSELSKQQKEQESDQGEETEQKKPTPAEQGEENKQESEPDIQDGKSPKNEEQPDGKAGSRPNQYFQGQMSQSDAMRILLALEESEKETQFQARRPKGQPGNPNELPEDRDW